MNSSLLPALPVNRSKESLNKPDYYNFHGIFLEIITDNPSVRDSLREDLDFFRCSHKPQGSRRLVSFQISTVDDFKPLKPLFPDLSQPISLAGQMQYFLNGRIISTIYPQVLLVLGDLDALTAQAYVHKEFIKNSWNIFQYVFSPIFIELLKEAGLFHVHAAAVSLDGRGFFFPGVTGSGKTTLSLCMVRKGFSFLSDDIIFIRRSASGDITLMSFQLPVHCWQKTISFFPELAGLRKNKGEEIRKTDFLIEDIYPGSTAASTKPSVMILPKLNGSSSSQLKRINRNDALLELIPQSIIVANRDIVKQHLSLLTDLIYQCDCYQLSVGNDWDNLSDMIRSL